jgi:hypothetical protein
MTRRGVIAPSVVVPQTPRRGGGRLRACTHKSRLLGAANDVCELRRLMFRRSSAAVATSREDHRPPGSGREGQHRRLGRGRGLPW